jgi:hypothetical protein
MMVEAIGSTTAHLDYVSGPQTSPSDYLPVPSLIYPAMTLQFGVVVVESLSHHEAVATPLEFP